MYPKAVKYLSAISLNERIKFLRLLFRWKGSLWKLLWADFLWFIISYIVVTLLYRFYLINDPYNKKRFESIVKYMNQVAGIVPLSFLLGFFVSTILGRWWEVVRNIPWMTHPAFTCQAFINGSDPTICRNFRLTIVRYMNLSWILSLVNLSQKIRDRFYVEIPKQKGFRFCHLKSEKPETVTLKQKMDKINEDESVKKCFGKLIMDEEITVFENFENKSHKPSYIVPLLWASKVVDKASRLGYLKSDGQMHTLIQNFRTNLGYLSVYNEFNIPLVYTQVIIIVVYAFLISEIFTQQLVTQDTVFVATSNNTMVKVDTFESYLPVFGIFKFLIYMGWFKVGLCFINPFGSEEIDLPMDLILDYNLEISASIGLSENKYFPDWLINSAEDNEILKMMDKFWSISSNNKSLSINDNFSDSDFADQALGDVKMRQL